MGLRLALLILAWIVASVIVALTAPFFFALSGHFDERMDSAFIVVGTWAIYRIGLANAGFPLPRGAACIVVNVTWVIATFLIVGGTIENLVGSPTLAAGFGGMVAAALLFLLLHDKTKARELGDADREILSNRVGVLSSHTASRIRAAATVVLRSGIVQAAVATIIALYLAKLFTEVLPEQYQLSIPRGGIDLIAPSVFIGVLAYKVAIRAVVTLRPRESVGESSPDYRYAKGSRERVN